MTDTDITQQIAPYANQAHMLNQLMAHTQISSDEELEAAGALVKQVKVRLNELQEAKAAITRPMRESLAATTALFGPVEDQYELAEKLLKAKISSYLTSRVEREKVLMQEAVNADDITTAVELASKAAPTVQGVSTRTTYEAEIVDAESIPRSYLVPDIQRIRADVRAAKGKIDIPGVRVVPRTSVAVSTK